MKTISTSGPDTCRWKAEERLLLLLGRQGRPCPDIAPLIDAGRIDWQAFLGTAARHRVSAAVLQKLLERPLPPGVPPETARALQRAAVAAAAETLLAARVLSAELARIGAAFRERDIDFVLLKGLAVDPSGLRESGDLDLLVRPARLREAIAVLEGIGCVHCTGRVNRCLTAAEREDVEKQLSWNNQFQLLHRASGLLIELHVNLFERERVYVEDLGALLDGIGLFWEESRPDPDLGCRVLAPPHLLLLMCLHGALKRSPANRRFELRTLLDIDRLAARVDDWDGFVRDCTRLKVAPFALFSLALAAGMLGTAVPPVVLQDLRRACSKRQYRLVLLHLRCLKSLNRVSLPRAKLYQVLKPMAFARGWHVRLRWLLLVPILFPPKRRMAARFHLPEDSPWVYLTYLLNPLRWIGVCARNLIGR